MFPFGGVRLIPFQNQSEVMRAGLRLLEESEYYSPQLQGADTAQDSGVAQNSVLLFRRTPFGRQGANPVLAQTSSNGHMQKRTARRSGDLRNSRTEFCATSIRLHLCQKRSNERSAPFVQSPKFLTCREQLDKFDVRLGKFITP